MEVTICYRYRIENPGIINLYSKTRLVHKTILSLSYVVSWLVHKINDVRTTHILKYFEVPENLEFGNFKAKCAHCATSILATKNDITLRDINACDKLIPF